MNRELQYNTVEMAVTVTLKVPLLTEEQSAICDRIMHAFSAIQEMDSFLLMKNWQKRKTFLILLIITEIQSNNDIALGIVSSGTV